MGHQDLLKKLSKKPIAYNPIYADLTGSLTAGVILSQLLYWWSAVEERKFYKSDAALQEETRCTEYELKQAKKILKTLPFLAITREGLPAKTYYAIDGDKLAESILALPSSSATFAELDQRPSLNSTGDLRRTVPATFAEHTIDTENTSENTTEIGSVPSPPSPRKKDLAPEAMEAAQLIAANITNVPGTRIPKPADLERWAVDIEKIYRLDKVPWPFILNTLKWALADAFWSRNIGSGKTFREKWDRLVMARHGNRSKPQPTQPVSTPQSDDWYDKETGIFKLT